MKRSRTYFAFLNIISGFFMQALMIFLGFFSRKVFVSVLGLEILGINGLFQNIIAFLSLAELGIGTAIICNLYKPLAEEDEETLGALMQFYAKVYNFLAKLVAVIGLLLIPFIPLLVQEDFDSNFLRLIFVLFASETVISYLFVYKRSIIIADQKNYLVSLNHSIMQLILTIAQIAVLYWTHNYVLFLILRIIIRLAENLIISAIANKNYPFLKSQSDYRLSPELYKNIITNTKALVLHYLALYFVNSTDNIIIARSLGIAYVGLLANYKLMTNSLKTLFTQFSKGIIASFGNLLAQKDPAKTRKIFYSAYYGIFLLFNFATVSFANLANPFIKLWLGEKALLSQLIVLLLSVDFFVHGITSLAASVRASAGVFEQDKYFHFLASILNLIISIILVRYIGLAGVLIGTITYRILEYLLALNWILHKYVLKSSFIEFLKKTFFIIFIAILSHLLSMIACSYANNLQLLQELSIKLLICLFIPNIVSILFLHRTEELCLLANKFKQARQ